MRISQYAQQQLASSLVGTAGGNNSGLGLAQTLTSGANALTDAVLYTQRQRGNNRQALMNIAADALGNVGQELRIRQAQQAEIEKKLYDDQMDSLASRHEYEVETLLSEQRGVLENENRSNPDAALGFYKNQGSKIIENYISNNNLPRDIQTRIRKAGYSTLTSQQNKLTDWAFTTRNNNIEEGLKGAAEMLKSKSARPMSVEEFDEQVLDFNNKFRKDYEKIKGVDGANNAIFKATSDAAGNWVNAWIKQDPTYAKEVILKKTPNIAKILGDDNILSLDDKATREITKREEFAHKQEKAANILNMAQADRIFGDAHNTHDRTRINNALNSLKDIKADIIKKPVTEFTRSWLKDVDGDISSLNSELNQMTSEANQLAAQRRQASAQEAQAAALQERNRLLGEGPSNARVSVITALENLKEFTRSKIENGDVTTDAALQAAFDARDALKKAAASGAFGKPGQLTKFGEHALGRIQAITMYAQKIDEKNMRESNELSDADKSTIRNLEKDLDSANALMDPTPEQWYAIKGANNPRARELADVQFHDALDEYIREGVKNKVGKGEGGKFTTLQILDARKAVLREAGVR